MKALGHDPIDAVTVDQIEKIIIEDYSIDYMAKEDILTAEQELMLEQGIYPTYTITDSEDIARILETSADDRYNNAWVERVDGYYIRVYTKEYQYSNQVTFTNMFLKGQVPLEILEAYN